LLLKQGKVNLQNQDIKFLENTMKKLTNTLGTLDLAGCAVIVSPFAVADDSGWYVGGNMGQSRSRIDDARIIIGLLGAGFATASITDNNRDTGYKFFGGYQINKNFAFEAGYFDLGKSSFIATTLPAGSLSGNIKLNGLNLDAVGILPISEKFSVLGRVGLAYAQAKDNFNSTPAVVIPTNPNPNQNGTNFKYGLGLQYNISQSLGIRAEAERYRVNDAVGNKGDIDLISVGLVYRFDEKKPVLAPVLVPKVAVPEPVVAPLLIAVIPPPAPPRVVPVVVAPPVPKKATFSADSSAGSLFDFGKVVIKPAGKKALDEFTADLKGASFEVITVTGHADRIGSHSFNQKLSKQRANAVRDYLIASEAISSDKIVADGVGESDPVTKTGECKGKKQTRKLIACLAPDRRIEVEVNATRTTK
jgi:OOP family OmpA-OmpF porin